MGAQPRKLVLTVIACVATAAATTTLSSGSAGAAQSSARSNDKTMHVVSDFLVPGESTIALPYFENAAQMAIDDLERQGWEVEYERIPGSLTSASAEEQAFLTAQGKKPDFWMGLGTVNVFIPIGPQVAQSGIPTFAFSSPTEGVKDGPAGGNNIYLMRPLNEEVAARMTDFACSTLKLKRIGLSLVQTALGPTVQQAVERTLKRYPRCKVVTVQTNSVTATDTTQQVLAFKTANVDGIISANFPGPTGVQVNQMRDNGLDVPYIGSAPLSLAVDSGSISTGVDDLYVLDDCVPDLKLNAVAKKFTNAYEARYGATPNFPRRTSGMRFTSQPTPSTRPRTTTPSNQPGDAVHELQRRLRLRIRQKQRASKSRPRLLVQGRPLQETHQGLRVAVPAIGRAQYDCDSHHAGTGR